MGAPADSSQDVANTIGSLSSTSVQIQIHHFLAPGWTTPQVFHKAVMNRQLVNQDRTDQPHPMTTGELNRL